MLLVSGKARNTTMLTVCAWGDKGWMMHYMGIPKQALVGLCLQTPPILVILWMNMQTFFIDFFWQKKSLEFWSWFKVQQNSYTELIWYNGQIRPFPFLITLSPHGQNPVALWGKDFRQCETNSVWHSLLPFPHPKLIRTTQNSSKWNQLSYSDSDLDPFLSIQHLLHPSDAT